MRGAELEGRWNIGQGLSVYGSYTRLYAKVRRSTDAASVGKRVALVPKQSASLGADYTFTAGALSGFGFGACVRACATTVASTVMSTTTGTRRNSH